jgi:hypothetical protein
MPQYRGNRIVVPQRPIGGGMDTKFETDPYNVEIRGLLTPEQYTDAMENVNRRLRPSRSGAVDKVLLATGPLLVPLALWGVRHSNQTRRRKRLLNKAIHEFNAQYPELLMRWNRRPESMLTIERKEQQQQLQPEELPQAQGPMAHAQLVGDLTIHVEPIPNNGTPPTTATTAAALPPTATGPAPVIEPVTEPVTEPAPARRGGPSVAGHSMV